MHEATLCYICVRTSYRDRVREKCVREKIENLYLYHGAGFVSGSFGFISCALKWMRV